jgi:AmmeMemoRadiSam system protein B
MDKPKLRPLNAVPVSRDGQELVCLYDATGLADKQVVVDPQTFFILSRFDGEHTLDDIKLAYTRRFGELLLGERLARIVEQLDEAMLLQSERLERYQAARLDAYRRSGVREPAHAGDGYPAEPDELREYVRSFFTMAGGPGRPEHAVEPLPVRLLVAPHIDFGRGARGYAHAYKALVEAAPADTYIILGIAHQPTSTPYAVTRNTFATPLGAVEVDADLVEAIEADYPGDLTADEGAHLSEHSVELHAVMLKALFEDRPFRIVPLLAASFDEFITDEAAPIELPQVEAMVRALKGALALDDKRVCLIAAVDLAHVGNQFGDPGELPAAARGAIEAADREMLATLEHGDVEAFMASVRADGGRRKICGVPALYTAVSALDGAAGDAPSSRRLLHYEQAFTPEIQSLVSFAAMVFR